MQEKIKQLSQELSVILQKIKEEKEINKSTNLLTATPENFLSKAYVTILREV